MATDPVIPFDYLEREKRRAQAPQGSDPIAEAIGLLRQEQIRSTIIRAPDPATTAHATRVARAAGEPPALIEDRVAEVAKAQNADRFTRVLGQYPAFTGWAIKNPRDAVAASNDHKSLGLLGDAWEALKGLPAATLDTVTKLPSTAIAAFDALGVMGAKINAAGADFLGGMSADYAGLVAPNTMTVGELEARKAENRAYFTRGVNRAQSTLEADRPQYTGFVQRNLLQGLESLPSSLMALGAGALTRNPNVALGLMGVQVGGPAVYDARVAGKGVGDALRYGIEQGAIEALTEKIPARALLENLTKRTPFGKAILGQLATEIPGEQVATALQDFSEWVNLHPERTFGQYIAERPEAALATLLQTISGTTAQTGGAYVVSRAAEAVGKVSRRMGAADDAARERSFFAQVEKANAESELKKLDPEAHARMMGEVAEANGVSSVFVPAEAVISYQQSDAYDQFEDPFGPYQAQIDEALATGGDVVLPADFALGTLPGTAAWSAIKDDLRLRPGGMSSREADDFNARLDEIMGEMTQQRAEMDQAQAGEIDARAALTERVTRELQNAGFTPTNAALQAGHIAQRTATRAARLGRNMQPGDFDTRIMAVLPPALAEMQQADRLDLVINAMRKGGDATKQDGKSLLDFIAQRGGIEDRGGDIAAMGGDKWHKGKVGRRKLLKAFDEAQGNMVGSSGANPNSLSNVLDAAISEGYFPELLARRENGEAIDDRELLDAIGQELGGSLIYPEAAKVDDVRLAADELRQMLEDAGRDPSGMSDVEIRRAIANQVEAMRGDGAIYDQMAETLLVDGVERPTRNSEGMPLAGSEEGVRAFWRWFGESKVVDEEGRPLVVYHGTTKSFEAFETEGRFKTEGTGAFFSADPDVAGSYAVRSTLDRADGEPQIYPVYLALENMPEVNFEGRNWNDGPKFFLVRDIKTFEDLDTGFFDTREEAEQAARDEGLEEYEIVDYVLKLNEDGYLEVDWDNLDAQGTSTDGIAFDAREAGFDGLKIENVVDNGGQRQGSGASDIYVAFSPTQIKSINNRGTFDPADARILYQSAYHGSPHIFDRFSLDAIGTGEGAQAYGWGLYFAGRKEIAEYYRSALSQDDMVIKVDGKKVFNRNDVDGGGKSRMDLKPKEHAILLEAISKAYGGEGAVSFGESSAEMARSDELKTYWRAVAREGRKLEGRVTAEEVKGGRTYRVEIPEDDEYLLWDKPLSEQPEKVRAGLLKAFPEIRVHASVQNKEVDALFAELTGEEVFQPSNAELPIEAGETFYHRLTRNLGSDRAASKALQDAGIAGIKYLDGGSRSNGEGSFNYVVFDDSRISITAYEQGKEPVASVSGTEIARQGVPIKDLRAKARDWFAANLRGNSVESRALGRLVTFASPKKMLAFSGDREKLLAVPALPEIIAKGELLWSREPYDQAADQSTKAYHRIGAAISISGSIKQVEITLREGPNGALYYDHILPENAVRNPEAPGNKAGLGETDGALNQIEQNAGNFNLQVRSLSEGPRGRISFPAQGFGTGPATIELFQTRNPSTLLHELGHQWLEELRYDASLPDAPDQLKADWQTVQDWFAANGHPVVDGFIPTEAHELWARGHERYLMEGKSPSSALQRMFETFRSWLLNVYRTVDALRAPISPEIRGVFDRLLATDEEIAQQREAQALMPMFKDAASIGMTGAEFDAYTEQAVGARDQASATLLQKTMASIRRRETKKFNDERRGVMAEEAERLDDAPILKSLRMMKDTPISVEWLRDRMGQDVTDLLPKRVPPIWKEGGMNPDALAEMAGFPSGQEMIEVLIGAEKYHREQREGGDQRTLRARMIEQAADAEMQRRYGDDPFNDGAIEREAIAAVNGELAGELLATEVRALGRRTGQRPTPYKIAREWARGRVRGGVVAEEASLGALQRHARNVAKAGREAEKAMLAGKMDEAFAAKQRQMLSSALLAEAKTAHDEVEAAKDRLAKIAKRKTMKSVDQDYLDQAHALLDAVDLGPRSQRSIDRQGKWEQWAAAREAEGYDVVVPASFEATLGRTPWSRMSVENLLGLDEAVKQVMHLGRLKQRLLDNQEEREWEDIFTEAEAAGGNIDGPPPADLAEPGWLESIKGGLLRLDAGLLKLETVFDWLDGGNSNGVFNRIAFRPVADAQAREADMVKDYFGRIKALFEGVPADTLARWGDRMVLPFTDIRTGRPMRVNRQQLVSMALNIGNEGNLQRLADGYRINPAAIEQYLNDTLKAEEWVFVQNVWDTIDTLWPQIEALEKRVNGVAPEKIAPRAFVTPFGQMKGGYFPAVYDASRDFRAEENQGKESDLLSGNFVRATTRSSATKERAAQVKRPILLDLGVINRHLGEVIHDITHREAVIQANRFLSSERVQNVIDAALGPEVRKQLRPWVKFVANSWAQERAGNEGLGRWIGKLRANATVVGMGFRATTMVTQLAGYSNSVEVVGADAMAKALAQFSANIPGVTREVFAKSGEMRNRMDTVERDVRTEIARLSAQSPASKAGKALLESKKFMFHGIGYMDLAVSVPTWLAGYNNAINAGMVEEDAVYAADKVVRQSQGASAPKDMAAIQRGTGKYGEALKLFTMFYSYFSAQYQRERTLIRDISGVDSRRSRSVPKLAARAFFLLVLPPLLVEVLRGAVGADSGPDDDEWWTEWVMRKLLANSLGPIPLARDLFEPAWNAAVGNKVFNPSISPIQRAYDSIIKTARDAGDLVHGEPTKHAVKDVLETTGYLTGLVPGQIASSTQFLVDVGTGTAEPQTFGDWVQGITTGKIKEEQ